jgi:hypothetical protein
VLTKPKPKAKAAILEDQSDIEDEVQGITLRPFLDLSVNEIKEMEPQVFFDSVLNYF